MTNRAALKAMVGSRFTEEQAASDKAGISGSGQYMKFEANSTKQFRILPGLVYFDEEGKETHREESWNWPIYKHFVDNYRGTGKPFVHLCPKKMGGGRCPSCDEQEKLANSKKSSDREAAEQYKVSARAICRVVDREAEKSGPMLCELPVSVFKKLCDLRRNKKRYGLDFTDIFEGDDIVVERTDGARTSYDTEISLVDRNRELSESEPQMMVWLDSSKAPSVDRAIEVKNYEQLMDQEKWLVKGFLGGGGKRAALGPSMFAKTKALPAGESEGLTRDTAEANMESDEGLEDESEF